MPPAPGAPFIPGTCQLSTADVPRCSADFLPNANGHQLALSKDNKNRFPIRLYLNIVGCGAGLSMKH